ncbi:GNAT family N-acetyltransferase [Pseudohalioglobus lutimaris]|uniref:N-acetyltransferase domain-containing protein n=1 Tax=Pseudohalioglobus lutimaris TaxID=1737061 RepID=A0A2N5X847_9GAMM|nr:GNAT family N-acetyltransferase [Pseudohalioglobus lutimaris]PLW70651.1 hypothetical protein C0039_00520 [Pseudohalioglobus lutimaris]
MSNEKLIDRFRKAEFPPGLTKDVEQFIAAATALRPLYPPALLYQIDFGERTLLRELTAPEEHDSHWWQTGLHIVRKGIAEHPALQAEFSAVLENLYTQLTSRLGPYTDVSLREITEDTVTGICLLSEVVTYPQNTFVAPNAYSLAQALFNHKAWYRAVYSGKAPVGFIMLEADAEKPEYYLWRFMIAPQFQRSGFGARAIELLVEHVKQQPNARELLLSYIDHEQGPAEFYRRLGFVETGEIVEGEVVMRLNLEVTSPGLSPSES